MQKFDFSDMDDLYQEIILDHYRSPRNQEQLADADIETEGVNPFCGDEVYLRVKLNDGHGGHRELQGKRVLHQPGVSLHAHGGHQGQEPEGG